MNELEINTIKFLAQEEPRNLKDLGMPLGVLIPRIDYFLSILRDISNTSINSIIRDKYKDGLKSYLLKVDELGGLGFYGRSVNPISYLCRFNSIGIDYHWIPKNACTFLKKNFASLNEQEIFSYDKNKFHETIQDSYGMNMSQYIDSAKSSNLKFAVLRNPIDRLVSCYIDKFYLPCVNDKDYEPYILNIIKNIYCYFDIKGDYQKRSVSFSEFLNYITNNPHFSSNEHWRPQIDFLRGVDLDFKVKQENVASFLMGKELLFAKKPKKENSSVGLIYNEAAYVGELSEKTPLEVNDELLDYSQFVTPSQHLLIKTLYAEDFSLYTQSI